MFSAIITASLITSFSNLQPDYQQQSALLLYQLLNGRDASLASLSDPTALFKPSGPSIAVTCLWAASLFMSCAASLGALLCKKWQAQYNNNADPAIDLLRACRRQVHFTTFQWWDKHAAALLPPLLLQSVLLFFIGCFIFAWQLNKVVATVYTSLGIIFFIIYMTLFPVTTNTTSFLHWVLLFYRSPLLIEKLIIPVADWIVHRCFIALRYLTDAVLWRFARTFLSPGALRTWCENARSIFAGKYKHMRVWWKNAFDGSLDQIDISPRVQEEAILWLSQMPLTDPSEIKAVVSSLALISPSRPHKFPQSVVVFLNSALESSCSGAPSRVIVDSVLALGRIKYQSVVDQNRDQDHTVGDIPVTALVAYAAQQLAITINAFEKDFGTPHSEVIRARLLAAAAWLSPVDAVEEVTPLAIRGRREFVKQIEIALMQHFSGKRPLDNDVLVELIHGMHASIPRGNYGTQASIIPFPLFACEDHSSPWSEDESVLRALITYALDLLSYTKKRKRLVEREIEFDELVLDLVDTLWGSAAFAVSTVPTALPTLAALTVLTTPAAPTAPTVPAVPAALAALITSPSPPEVVVFCFRLIHRVPHAFRSRENTLCEIIDTWNTTKESMRKDHHQRKRLNFHAVNAFVAVARHHLISKGKLLKFRAGDILDLLKASLEDSSSRPVVACAVTLILKFGTSKQVTTLSADIDIGSFADIFHTVRSDPEANAAEEDVLNLHIHTALLPFKPEQLRDGIERIKALIGEMKHTIEDAARPGPVSTKDSEDEMNRDTDRVRWKAIYLSGLLVGFLPPDERGERIKPLREKVKTMVENGQLLLAKDYARCLKPLGGGQVKLQSPAERKGKSFTAFETWIDDFPLFPSAGSVLGRA